MPAPDPNRKVSPKKLPSGDGYRSFTSGLGAGVYGGGLYTPEMAAAWATQRAGMQSSYTATLAALAGQRKNIQARFRMDRAGIKADTITKAVAAEAQAVERGVLGGSADVKNRIAVKSAGAAALEAARLEKTQSISDNRQQQIQATYSLALGLAGIEGQEAAARATATVNELANGDVQVTGSLARADIVKNGVFGDIVEQIGRTQVGVAAYKFGSKNPGTSFDCSGFTSWVMEQATGVVLPHNAQQQFLQLTDNKKNRLDRGELKAGDLLFFNFGRLAAGTADHVAIYLGNGWMMDASSSNNSIVVRAIPWESLLGGGRVANGVLPKWGGKNSTFTTNPFSGRT